MAAGGGDPSAKLLEEATCSICLDYFRDPVMIADCGHNFCRDCIAQYQETGSGWDESPCPQCRIRFPSRSLRPNRDLGNLVDAIRRLRLQPRGEPVSERIPNLKMCQKHKEAAKLFCQEDKAFICLVCRESRAHKDHNTLPIEEAFEEYQNQIQSFLTLLTKEKEEILKTDFCNEKQVQQVKRGVESARQRIASTFPKEKAKTLLPLLNTCEADVKTIIEVCREFSERSSRLTKLISEIKEKRLQSSFEFLQEIGDLLSRCEREIVNPKHNLTRMYEDLHEKMKVVLTKLDQCPAKTSKPKWIKENVLLDPETAHPRYVVSRDRKNVRWGDCRKDWPYNPKRFEYARCVLGKKGFTSGKHYWSVDVEDVDYWAVGVAQESVDRDGELDFEPDEGIWALARYDDQYKALTSPPTLLDLMYDPVEIQVSLNCDAGTVTFFDENKTRLFIFRSIDFEGEKIFPFFRISSSSGSLQLC